MHVHYILIADDSEEDRTIFKLAIRPRDDLQVAATTATGNDTMAYLQGAAPYSDRLSYPYPDLLLLDYEMPGANGLEVLGWLQKQPRRPRVILWTNMIEKIDRAEAYRLGANLACAKPSTPQEILAHVSRVLSGPRQSD